MRKHILTILSAVVLALSVPLLAQTADEPVTQPVAQEQPETQPAEAPLADEVTLEEEEAVTDAEATDGEQEMPATASPLALLLLIGAGTGASAYGLRRNRRF